MKWALIHLSRAAWLLVGFTALGLGALGIVLPLLPTTPFLLVAAFAFANASKRLHAWLLEHRLFGTLIDDWNRYRAISRTAKFVGVVSMIAVLMVSVVFDVPLPLLIVQALVLAACAAFIVSRPSPPG
ncbi:MAG: YbaN family protein [Woeseiaceae bacterium]|nr:YbaN family protein [Woeseiaceae bacterium]